MAKTVTYQRPSPVQVRPVSHRLLRAVIQIAKQLPASDLDTYNEDLSTETMTVARITPTVSNKVLQSVIKSASQASPDSLDIYNEVN